MKRAKWIFEGIFQQIFGIVGKFIPVKRNRILFYSFTGNQYSCSPKYISDYINEYYPEKYEIIWAFRNTDMQDLPTYAKIVKYQTILFFYYHLSAKAIVSNIYPYHLIGTKKDQIMLDTWHGGGAYKVAGFDFANGDKKSSIKILSFYQQNINAFVSSSELFTKFFIRKGMRFNGTVIPAGLPRNDIFFWEQEKKEAIIQKVYTKLNIPREYKLFLYAPTWRNEEDSSGFQFDTKKLKAALSTRFGGKWKILVRMHIFTSTNIVGDVIDVKDYPDMQELLLACELLVSDYSSSIWDYSLTGKPCLLYTYDLDKYTSGRGFYVDIEQWGFPLCKTFEELTNEILHFDTKRFRQNMKNHYEMLGGFDQGDACEKTVEYLTKSMMV